MCAFTQLRAVICEGENTKKYKQGSYSRTNESKTKTGIRLDAEKDVGEGEDRYLIRNTKVSISHTIFEGEEAKCPEAYCTKYVLGLGLSDIQSRDTYR